MDNLFDEAIDEATGASPRRWALLLLVFVAGGLVALWLAKRARAEAGANDQTGGVTTEPAAAATTASATEPAVTT